MFITYLINSTYKLISLPFEVPDFVYVVFKASLKIIALNFGLPVKPSQSIYNTAIYRSDLTQNSKTHNVFGFHNFIIFRGARNPGWQKLTGKAIDYVEYTK